MDLVLLFWRSGTRRSILFECRRFTTGRPANGASCHCLLHRTQSVMGIMRVVLCDRCFLSFSLLQLTDVSSTSPAPTSPSSLLSSYINSTMSSESSPPPSESSPDGKRDKNAEHETSVSRLLHRSNDFLSMCNAFRVTSAMANSRL